MILSHDVDAIYDRAVALTVEEVVDILERAYREHHDDPNFPAAVLAKIEYFLSGDSSTLEGYDNLLEEMKIEAGLIQVRAPLVTLLRGELDSYASVFSSRALTLRFARSWPASMTRTCRPGRSASGSVRVTLRSSL